MKFYVLNSSAVECLIQKAERGCDADAAVRGAAERWHQDSRLDYVVEGYAGILDDYDIDSGEWAEDPLAEALSEASEGECEWFVFSDAKAAELRAKLAKVTISDDEIVPYFDALRWDGDVAADVRAAHRLLQNALADVRSGCTGVLRVRD